jgi:RNA-binding protein YhbY
MDKKEYEEKVRVLESHLERIITLLEELVEAIKGLEELVEAIGIETILLKRKETKNPWIPGKMNLSNLKELK